MKRAGPSRLLPEKDMPEGPPMAEPAKSARNTLFLEDLHVGQRFASASHTLDEAQIKAFAAQYDPQPFHLDGEAAKMTLFGGLAASGWHTAAITMKLLVDSGLPLAAGIIGTGGEINWPKPTRPGDTLTVMSEIEEVTPSRSRPERGMIRVRSETRNQRGEIVQTLNTKLIVLKRGSDKKSDAQGPSVATADAAKA
jgi:acyl dehydratase